jgi:hypothetical protein
MAKQQIDGMLTHLHERFATSETSPAQDALLQQLHSQLAEWEGALPPDGNVVSTAELLLQELEDEHPQLSHVVRELIAALGRIGI